MAILAIGVIIAFHELGHFAAAKACGVGVVEFALGMGPMLVHKRIGETVYSLRAIPMGGFCAMYGEQSVEADGAKGRDFKSDWEPFRSFDACPGWQRFVIALAGPAANVLLAFLLLMTMAAVSGPKFGPVEVVELGPVAVAEEAGVRVGDILTRVDGRKIETSGSYSFYIDAHPRVLRDGYTLTVYRPSDGTTHDFFLVPDPEAELVGVTYKSQNQTGPFPFLDAGWRLLKTYATMSVDSVAMLLRGDAGLGDLSSMIGIATAMGDTIEEASDVQEAPEEESDRHAVASAILSLAAMVSMGLAIMNMLPLPALDGGRALITIGEGIAGRRLPRKVESMANGLCMLVLMLLMGVTMVMDLVRLLQSM